MPIYEMEPSSTTPRGFTGLRVVSSGEQRYFSFLKGDGTGRLQSKTAIKKIRAAANRLNREWKAERLEHKLRKSITVSPQKLKGHIYSTGIPGLCCRFKPSKGRLHLCVQATVGRTGKDPQFLARTTAFVDSFDHIWRECAEALAQFRGIELPQAWIDAKPSLRHLRMLRRATAKRHPDAVVPDGLQF